MNETDIANRLKAIADPTRLSVLAFLRQPLQNCCISDEGVCACDIETFLGLSQPTISHHMKLLVGAGFVKAQKQGRWVYYSLNGAAFEVVREMLHPFAQASELQTSSTSLA